MRLFITVLFVCFFSKAKAQFFSGEITYRIEILPKNDSVDITEIQQRKHGTEATYIIMPKYYRSTYSKNGKYNYAYIYHDETKRMYDDYVDKPYITYRDSQKYNYEYYGSEVFKDSTATILERDCFMVRTKAEFGVSKTYYSESVKVDYSHFEGHKIGNWYNKLKEANGCISLKSVTEHKDYFEIQEAIKIMERPVEISEFELPDKPIAASYSALDTQVAIIQPSNRQLKCYQDKLRRAENTNGEKITSYISFILKTDGEKKFIEPYEKDDKGYHKIAMDVLENCGFEFTPGKIDNEKVDSQVFFPVEFSN